MGISKASVVAASLVTLLVGCAGEKDEREQHIEAIAAEHGVNADVSLDAEGEVESISIHSAGGGQVGKNLQLPDDFPDDVLMAPNWDVMSISPAPGGFMVQAMTDVSMEDALAAAREQLTSEGWEETGFAQPNPMMSQARFSKGDRSTNINVMDTGAQRTLQLMTMTP